jgi:3-dehydroshikimate dehydratase
MRNLICTAVALAASVSAPAAVFTVTNTNNSGSGSLRQAILDSNAASPSTTGPNVIELGVEGVIKVEGQFLPPVKGPAVLRPKAAAPSGAGAPAPGGRGGRGGPPPALGPKPLPDPKIILEGSALVTPRTPAACPGATFNHNAATNEWEATDRQGTGPNVRGWYGAGLAVHDSHDVEISGVQIQNFCAGIAVVRSNGVFIHDVKILENHGAAGVIFTGDDGKSGRTDLSFNNRLVDSYLLDNGDGLEFTRGTRDSVVQGTTITLTHQLPEEGNAIEFAQAGDNIAVMANTFSKYVDVAVTVSGNRHTIRDNKFINNQGPAIRINGTGMLILGNTFADNNGPAITITGAGSRILDNVITGNAGQGILVGSNGITIERNSIYNNAHLGIDMLKPGQGRGGPPPGGGAAAGGRGAGRGPGPGRGPAAAPAAPPELPDIPVLLRGSDWNPDGLFLSGVFSGKPGQSYRIDFYMSHKDDRHAGDEKGLGEGERYLGAQSVVTDNLGNSNFLLPLRMDDPLGDGANSAYFTATVTDDAGTTGRFSRSVLLDKR